MKKEYGQVYCITNNITNKRYIGITVKKDVLKDRYKGSLLKSHNEHLRNSVLKYGEDNFSIDILDIAYSEEELMQKEVEYIEKFDTRNADKGYNKREGGYGRRLNEEELIKRGKCIKKWWDTAVDRKEMLRESMTGDKNFLVQMGGHTEEAKKKMSDIKKQQLKEGKASMEKARLASLNPEAVRKRVISKSRDWFIQYDEDWNEINRFHTLKDTYNYMIQHNMKVQSTYGGFKLKHSQEKVFNTKKLFEGYYWEREKKDN